MPGRIKRHGKCTLPVARERPKLSADLDVPRAEYLVIRRRYHLVLQRVQRSFSRPSTLANPDPSQADPQTHLATRSPPDTVHIPSIPAHHTLADPISGVPQPHRPIARCAGHESPGKGRSAVPDPRRVSPKRGLQLARRG